MDSKVHSTNKIVLSEIVQIVSVVDVIDLNLIVFALFEMVLDIETFDPYRVEVIHDNFCPSYFMPRIAWLFIKYDNTVSARKSIQIW